MKRLWWNYVTIRGYVDEYHPDHRRVYLINVLLLFTVTVTIVFFALHLFWTGFMYLVVMNLVGFVMTLAAMVYLRASYNIELVASILHFIAFFGLGLYLVFTHDQDQAYMWAAVYFPFAFFLKGRIWGSLYAFLFYLLIAGGAFYHMALVDSEPVAVVARTLLNMTASILALCGTLYYYEVTRLEASRRLHRAQAELLELSTTDGLTSLYNRRHFDNVLPVVLAKARREGGVFCFLTLDVDHFKAYNDYYGHPQGDEVLKAIATAMKDTFKRDCDLSFRLGGEEFGVLFSVAQPSEALALAEALRVAVEAQNIRSVDAPLGRVTISIGLRLFNADAVSHHVSVSSLVSEADLALYQAKHEGRNRVILYQQPAV